MPISEKTKTAISGANKVEEQIADFAFDPGATPVYRLNSDEVPKTSDDMTRLYKWQHGDKIYGTHAKEEVGMNEYIKDINKAFGRQKDYEHNMIFINDYKPIGDKLEKLKK